MPSLQTKISELKKTGRSNSEIIENLKKEGHKPQEIYDAMSRSQENSYDDLTPPTPSEEMGGSEQEFDDDVQSQMMPETRNFIQPQKFPAPFATAHHHQTL